MENTSPEGLVQIHPQIHYQISDPHSGARLQATDWQISGLWNLAQVESEDKSIRYWTDLPYGIGVSGPCYLNPDTGEVSRPEGPRWYADLTRQAWATRESSPVELQVERRHQAHRICLVNCLIPWWGDGVSLLLRINQIRRHLDLDLVVLAPKELVWLVPDYVAEIWIDTAGLGATRRWREGLAAAVKARVKSFEICYIPTTSQPAHLSPSELQEFTGIPPFPRSEWLSRLEQKPTVTFMWRPDRCWARDISIPSHWPVRTQILRKWVKQQRQWSQELALRQQIQRVTRLAEELRRQLPALDFALCGLGRHGNFPDWIQDLRTERVDQQVNEQWCRRASQSHVMIGVLGSHLTLPSGHAGAIVQLVPWSFYRNVLTDIVITTDDPREALYCYRLLTLDVDPRLVCGLVLSLLFNYPGAHYAFHGDYYRPLSPDLLKTITQAQRYRSQVLSQITTPAMDPLIGP